MVIIERDKFGALVSSLLEHGYTLIGPVARGGAIVLDEIHAVQDLASGYAARQGPGSYRLTPDANRGLFPVGNGPHSWKSFLFPSRRQVFSVRRSSTGMEFDAEGTSSPVRYAFLGVRPCDLSAIGIQDRVFLRSAYSDPAYGDLREQSLIIAVNCVEAGDTCFCASMGMGPRADSGYDLALTELETPQGPLVLVEVGTARGREVLDGVPQREATAAEAALAARLTDEARTRMGRTLDAAKVKERLPANPEHPRWEETARRCLTCANCTSVCPTCFCSDVEDVTDLTGSRAERWRRWDSCFTMEFSYIHGGSIRASARSRYRQWVTHKLAAWHDQFGTTGCVGCGRCITWCPVGIDITEEATVICATGAGQSSPVLQEENAHGNP
jgi:ferredoxin